jgi:hypothetical protein
MVQCPNCQANLKDDIGLVTCASCGSQVLLELDGSVSQALPSPTNSSNILTDETYRPAEMLDIFSPTSQPMDSPTNLDISLDHSAETPMNPSSHSLSIAPLLNSPSQSPASDPRPKAPAESMQDVVDYANSTSSQGREGLLRFHVTITGIDTTDIRKKIADVISDERFLWDTNQLISSIQSGRLEIRELTPVKAALLVQKLKQLPVEIYWEQYAIHQ